MVIALTSSLHSSGSEPVWHRHLNQKVDACHTLNARVGRGNETYFDDHCSSSSIHKVCLRICPCWNKIEHNMSIVNFAEDGTYKSMWAFLSQAQCQFEAMFVLHWIQSAFLHPIFAYLRLKVTWTPAEHWLKHEFETAFWGWKQDRFVYPDNNCIRGINDRRSEGYESSHKYSRRIVQS